MSVDNLLCNYNIFDENHIDHDPIDKNRTWYNIYNNNISRPLSNFMFSITNAKYRKFDNSDNICFYLNNKNNNTKKLISYIKNVYDVMYNKIIKINPSLQKQYPLKETTNFPYLLSTNKSQTTKIVDENNNHLDNLINNNYYSLIFEISNCVIRNNTLYMNFNLLISKQEIEPNFLDYNFNKPEKIIEFNQTRQPITTPINNNNSINTKPIVKIGIDPSELLKLKSGLKKVNLDNQTVATENNTVDEYVSKKNELKKTETVEKSLLDLLNSNSVIQIDNDNNIEKKKKKKKDKEHRKEKKEKRDKSIEITSSN